MKSHWFLYKWWATDRSFKKLDMSEEIANYLNLLYCMHLFPSLNLEATVCSPHWGQTAESYEMLNKLKDSLPCTLPLKAALCRMMWSTLTGVSTYQPKTSTNYLFLWFLITEHLMPITKTNPLWCLCMQTLSQAQSDTDHMKKKKGLKDPQVSFQLDHFSRWPHRRRTEKHTDYNLRCICGRSSSFPKMFNQGTHMFRKTVKVFF